MSRKKKRLVGNIVLSVTVVIGVILLMFTIRLYLNKIDEKTREVMNETDTTFISKDNKTNQEGLFVANLKEDLLDYLEDFDANSVTYKIEGEPFYLDIKVVKEDDDSLSFSIERIINEEKKVFARMNLEDVESIEYRTGNANSASLLKINTEFYSDYFAITNEDHYFLGSDIETVSYKDNQFYYISYNPNYSILETAKTCSKDVKSSIDGFSTNDYYYKYGKINFLPDYYQKLASKKFSVGEKCDELKKANDAAKKEEN